MGASAAVPRPAGGGGGASGAYRQPGREGLACAATAPRGGRPSPMSLSAGTRPGGPGRGPGRPASAGGTAASRSPSPMRRPPRGENKTRRNLALAAATETGVGSSLRANGRALAPRERHPKSCSYAPELLGRSFPAGRDGARQGIRCADPPLQTSRSDARARPQTGIQAEGAPRTKRRLSLAQAGCKTLPRHSGRQRRRALTHPERRDCGVTRLLRQKSESRLGPTCAVPTSTAKRSRPWLTVTTSSARKHAASGR